MKLQLPRLLVFAVIGFVTGVVFQKTLTVGRSKKWIVSLFAGEAKPQKLARVTAAEFDWRPYQNALSGIKITLRSEADVGGDLEKLRRQLPDEIAFQQSAEVRELARELIAAKKDNRVTPREVRLNRFFRWDEVDYHCQYERQKKLALRRTEAVLSFSKRLKARGIHLIFLAVPNAVDVSIPAMLGHETHRSSSPRHTEFLISLAENGISVVDLRGEFGRRTMRGEELMHRFDHHWTPLGIEVAAEKASERIFERFEGLPKTPIGTYAYQPVFFIEPVTSFPDPSIPRTGSPVFARQVTVDGKRFGSAPDSRIVVFGDSMILHCGDPYSADFTSHLSARLGYPCRAYGREGGGRQVPRMFFEEFGFKKSARDPDLVLWVCVSAHREFVIPILPEGENAIADFPASATYQVRVMAVSAILTPQLAPYPDALYSFTAKISAAKGDRFEATIITEAFAGRVATAATRVKTGESHTMKLVPWTKAKNKTPKLGKQALLDDFNDFTRPVYFWSGD